ncbi:MAG: nucleotidyltransferase family protein [Brevinematia bacterium]
MIYREEEIIRKLKKIKEKYINEGIIILGFFGSFARGEASETSDLDIIYEMKDFALEKYPGFKFFEFYSNIKADIEKEFGISVDLVDINSLNEIGRKYILPEVKYVA